MTTKVRRWNPVAKHDHNKGGHTRTERKMPKSTSLGVNG